MERLGEHKLKIVIGLLLMGFVVFAINQKPSEQASTSVSATASKFKQVNLTSPMSRGKSSAKVSIIQYSDFLCPSCSYFSTQIMPTIDQKYVQTGKAKFEFRPMAFIADGSTQAGMGAYCAIDQGKFWSYHDSIYGFVASKVLGERLDPKTQTILTPQLVNSLAASAGLKSDTFSNCLDSGEGRSKIVASTQTANQNGVTGTPYIMINGRQYQGDMSLSAVEALIKASL